MVTTLKGPDDGEVDVRALKEIQDPFSVCSGEISDGEAIQNSKQLQHLCGMAYLHMHINLYIFAHICT